MEDSLFYRTGSLRLDFSGDWVELVDRENRWKGHGQWVEFYAALALIAERRPDDTTLSVDELALSDHWAQKKRGSIGKEVARHLDKLDTLQLSRFVLAPKKTSRWQLGLHPRSVEWIGGQDAAEQWFQTLGELVDGQPVHTEGDFLYWLGPTLCGLIRFEQGLLKKAARSLRFARQRAPSISTRAVSEYFLLRIQARTGTWNDEEFTHLDSCPGRLGTAIRIRAEAARAFQSVSADFVSTRAHLARLAARLEAGPDLQGLGSLYNAMGVISRREGHLRQATSLLELAIRMLLPTSDHGTLQAAIFNLGHCQFLEAKTAQQLRQAQTFLKLDRLMHRHLQIGAGSAQAEIVLASAAIELDRPAEAKAWLQAGRELAARTQSRYDQAGILRLEARLLWGEPTPSWKAPGPQVCLQARRLLDQALANYLRAGITTPQVRKELESVRRARPIQWNREEVYTEEPLAKQEINRQTKPSPAKAVRTFRSRTPRAHVKPISRPRK